MEPSAMQCQVCLRPGSARLPFNCTTCARNSLYEPRIQHAQILLQKEAISKDAERVVVAGQRRDTSNRVSRESTSVAVEYAKAQQHDAVESTETTLGHVEALREEVKQMKADIGRRKAQLFQRRVDLTSAKQELEQRQQTSIEPVEKSIKKTEYRWDALHTKTVESRVFLCRETAKLYGLQQRRRKKSSTARDNFMIGGVPIVDLRDVNNSTPTQITVSILHLANLIHLTSHYLSLRLPAEIVLPDSSNPRPMIFSPTSSYNHSATTLPTANKTAHSFLSSAPSPSQSMTNRRPRPLYLDKPLPILAKEDPITYSLFVDGITLLAWDIAWVCKTQGLNIGANSWEDVCAMGHNLWQLFVAPAPNPRPPISRNASKDDHSALSRRTDTPLAEPYKPNPEDGKPQATLGHFSHGTNHSFLASAEGADYMRGWKLQNPIRLIEKVKAALASERMGAEWELLDEGEWEEEPGPAPAPSSAKDGKGAVKVQEQQQEEPVLVKAKSKGAQIFDHDEARSVVTAMTIADDDLAVFGEDNNNNTSGGESGKGTGTGTGTSGWTKLKSRAGV